MKIGVLKARRKDKELFEALVETGGFGQHHNVRGKICTFRLQRKNGRETQF